MPAVSSSRSDLQPGGFVALPRTVGNAAVIALSGELSAAAPDASSALSAALRLTVQRGGALSAVGLRPGLISRVQPLVAAGLHLCGSIDAAVRQTEYSGTEQST
jgi:hypothetical protein